MMKLFTIGFTQKSAERFFNILKTAGVKRVVDILLNIVSQPAGLAKRHDLRYFLKTICDIDYIHIPKMAAMVTGEASPRHGMPGDPTVHVPAAPPRCPLKFS